MDIWEVDDYYRTKMENEKLKSLESILQKKKSIIGESMEFLRISNDKATDAHLIPKFSWNHSDSQHFLYHSVSDSPYNNRLKPFFEIKKIQSTIEDMTNQTHAITTEVLCGPSSKKKHFMYCTHIGLVEDTILKRREMKWPENSEQYFDTKNNIDIPLNTFSPAFF